MEFTYAAYEHLVVLLKGQGYTFANYKQAGLLPGKVVIMRHDVDFSLPKAVEMARLENRLGIESTYFVLLATDMYNVFSAQSHALLSEITALGHDIGLHFDEVRYQGASLAEIKQHVLNEASILASAMGSEVDAVSMHRPSSAMLESDMQFGALYNSYSRPFFGRAGGGEYKYVSDSRMHWREDVFGLIRSGEHDRLHILTHPFWYADVQESMRDKLISFILSATADRRASVQSNFTALDEVIGKEGVAGNAL